ncbi:UNVERIFIED_CONTAM: VOC family protein [Kocuria sp. CPCC 205316]|uniref:VOC family protein n=1 Tax=Kocuria TaxID=57493 RepID=UPI0036DC80DB
MSPQFRGGLNLAMKLPKAQFEATVAFYRDVLNMEVTEVPSQSLDGTVPQSVSIPFGPVTLWLDRVDNYAQAEIWLELFTDDVETATQHLAQHGVPTQDELEALPTGLQAHWISNPAGIPHVLRHPDS